jgi:flavin reductase (DIM6/NTAB) family NADH-FMN oxidoreductase RutF
MFNTSLHLDEKCHSQPRIAALLTCADNIMPLAWHMPVSKSPFRYAVAVRSENYTHGLITKNKEFALNFLDISYQHAYQICGEVHGENIDKFELSGLHKRSASSIESTLIDEAYMIYECTLVDIINYGDHDIFIADVNLILNKETTDVEPTLFMGKGYYDTVKGEPIRLKRSMNV